MRRAGPGLSAWTLFLTTGVAQLPACGGQSSDTSSASGAANSAAGADAVGAAGSAGSVAGSEPAACTWPAAFNAVDHVSGQCTAARTQLECVGSNGTTEDCLSDNFSTCPDSGGGVDVSNAVCKSICKANEFGLICGGVGPEAPSSSAPPACRAALNTPAGVTFYCCPCGAADGGVCAPLGPVTSSVKLVASDIVAAGRDADGTLYVLTEHDGAMRLFVSDGFALVEKFEAGTGEGSGGATQFWTFQYADPDDITVEVQKDASGTRMGVAKGHIAGKGFDVGSTGSVLTLVGLADVTAMPALSTQTFHVTYSGAAADGTNVVVIEPDHDADNTLRVFLGPVGALQEQVVTSVGRGLSIPEATVIELTVQGAAAELRYVSDSTSASLTGATENESFTGPTAPAAPASTNFLCR